MKMHWDPGEVVERALTADWMVEYCRPEGPTVRQEGDGGEVREAARAEEENRERRGRRSFMVGDVGDDEGTSVGW